MVEKKEPWPGGQRDAHHTVPTTVSDSDLDAVWRLELGLDLEDRPVLEAEVLISRICAAKRLPKSAVRRTLEREWDPEE